MSRSKLREAHIPILLWLPAAAMLHLGGGTGASEMAVNVAERASILRFSRGVRSQVAASVDGSSGPSEIEILDEAPPLPDCFLQRAIQHARCQIQTPEVGACTTESLLQTRQHGRR